MPPRSPRSAGKVEVEDADRTIKVTVVPSALDENGEPIPAKEYSFPRRTRFLVTNGDVVEAGDPLNEGSIAPAELLALKGSTATELYLVGEVQKVYKSQGVDIHDKHIELIVRQMLKKVRVESAGDTPLLPGQLVDKAVLARANDGARKAKKEEATFEPLILGITKASLATESFLSAASFQETTKVLTDAAIEGKIDRLLGLKENVIIGKLIPAATGLKKYRGITIEPAEPLPSSMFAAEAQELLAALEEIGDGDDRPDRARPRVRGGAARRGRAARARRVDESERTRARARRAPRAVVRRSRPGVSPGRARGSPTRLSLSRSYAAVPLPASLARCSARSARSKSETPSSSGFSSAIPADRLRPGPAERWPAAERGLEPGEQRLGVDPAGLGQDHGELVAAGAAGEVGRPDRLAEQIGDLDEQAVACDLPDAAVRQLEVVEVEHADGQPAPVAVRARDLERERLVEALPVAEPGQAVGVRQPPRPSRAAGRSRSPARRGGRSPRASGTRCPRPAAPRRARRRSGTRAGRPPTRAARRSPSAWPSAPRRPAG